MLKELIRNLPSSAIIIKSSFTATRELLTLNAKYSKNALANSVNAANLMVQNSLDLVNSLSNIESGNDLIQRPKAFVEATLASLTEITEANVQLTQAAAEDYQAWAKQTTTIASEDYQAWFKDAAKAVKAVKAAA